MSGVVVSLARDAVEAVPSRTADEATTTKEIVQDPENNASENRETHTVVIVTFHRTGKTMGVTVLDHEVVAAPLQAQHHLAPAHVVAAPPAVVQPQIDLHSGEVARLVAEM